MVATEGIPECPTCLISLHTPRGGGFSPEVQDTQSLQTPSPVPSFHTSERA